MKRLNLALTVLVVALFMVFALGSGESETVDQGKAGVDAKETVQGSIGKYSVVIDSCRMAKDYSGKDVVIIKYLFTNVADENAASFYVTFDDQVYQNGVGLNEAYILDDSANYDDGNQMKEIKKGVTLTVEVAYELNDTTTDIEVELSELFSFNDTKITKTFSIG